MLHFASQRVFAIYLLTVKPSLKILKEGDKYSINDNKDEAMNYSYIFTKDIFEYNERKGKMEYFDANLVYNTIYDRH